MGKLLSSLAVIATLLVTGPVLAANPVVNVETTAGSFRIELYPERAPVTVANFLRYVEDGFYTGTIFHRVIKRFVVQGGGFTPEMERKPTYEPIINEDGNGLFNDRWTVAMARTPEPDSATSQFFINLRINSSLNGRGANRGYAVFGEVIDGRDVINSIANQPTDVIAGMSDVPIEPVIIQSITLETAAEQP